MTSDGRTLVSSKARPARARRLTGAGDVWDAASVVGRLDGMEDLERLRFANAAARYYVSAELPVPPRREDVLAAL